MFNQIFEIFGYLMVLVPCQILGSQPVLFRSKPGPRRFAYQEQSLLGSHHSNRVGSSLKIVRSRIWSWSGVSFEIVPDRLGSTCFHNGETATIAEPNLWISPRDIRIHVIVSDLTKCSKLLTHCTRNLVEQPKTYLVVCPKIFCLFFFVNSYFACL